MYRRHQPLNLLKHVDVLLVAISSRQQLAILFFIFCRLEVIGSPPSAYLPLEAPHGRAELFRLWFSL
jgi:hypothetical protein